MSCFWNHNNNKLLKCRSCNELFTLCEEDFPEDLFSLILKYDLPQLHWFCKSCNKWRVTQKDVQSLDIRLTELETNFKAMQKGLSDYRNNDNHVSTSSPVVNTYGNHSITDDSYDNSFSSHNSSSSSNCSIRPNNYPPNRNKDALKILNIIMTKEIKIDDVKAKISIEAVDSFLLALNPYLKKLDPVFKYLYSRDYKTGSSYNDLKISSGYDYDINIMLVLREPFKLEVDFFKETMAFAKLKWSKTADIVPDSKLCVLNFLEKHSVEGYLDPEKIKAWFHSLVVKFAQSMPEIKGVEKFKVTQSGPARTIKMTTTSGTDVDLDLVPVFVFTFDIFKENEIPRLSEYSLDKSKEMCSFVPKKCDGEEKLLASDCKLSWRIYIPELDKKVWHKKECAKNIIKLLKLLGRKQDWKSLKSYHMATVILWEIKESNEDPNVWTGNLAYDRFIKALEKLEMYLSKKCLPYFLYPQYNLFHSFSEAESENLSYRIKAILKQLNKDCNSLYTIFKISNV